MKSSTRSTTGRCATTPGVSTPPRRRSRNAAAVARHLGVRGPVLTLSSACSSGGLAVGTALDLIRSGDAAVVIAAGADALCPLTDGGFNSLRSVSAAPSRPVPARAIT